MGLGRSIRLKLRALFQRADVERELDDEFRFHIEMEAAKNLRAGMAPEDAFRAARIAFGGTDRYAEEVRAARGMRWLEDGWSDLRVAARQFRRRPGFSALAVTTLALGIGANTTVFSVVSGVLLRPLPYPEPERLVSVMAEGAADGYRYALSVADVRAWQEAGRVFTSVGGYYFLPSGLTVDGPEGAEPVPAMLVTTGLFDVLGVVPVRGRQFVEADGVPGADRVALVSEGFWRSRLGSSSDRVGRSILMDGEPVTVVGVMPGGFRVEGAPPVDAWLPLRVAEPTRRGPFYLRGIGRLADGVSLEQARADLARVTALVDERFPPDSPGGWRFLIVPLKDALVGESRATILLLMGAVGLVLLVAVGTATNLFLARATTRGQETAVRVALGAGRFRLVRQQVTESLFVSVAGAMAGVLLAFWAVPSLARIVGPFLPRAHEVSLDVRVLAFTAGAALFAGLATGAGAALHPRLRELMERLRDGGRGQAGPRSTVVRRWLVGSELALAFVVLMGALLLVQSLRRMESVDAGVAPAGVLTARIALPAERYPEPGDWAVFFRELLRRVESIPGVFGVAVGSSLPPDRLTFENDVAPFGHPEDRPTPIVHQVLVSEGFFSTMGIAVRQGRVFATSDAPGSTAVVVVSRSLAERFWPGTDAIGQRVVRGGVEATVVGVVDDVKYEGLDESGTATFYSPYFQSLFFRSMYITIRSALATEDMTALLRGQLRLLDTGLALRDVSPLERLFHESVATPRFRSLLFSTFGVLALMLALAGVYGVLAFAVTERRRETGLRMALGATTSSVVRLVVMDGMRLVTAALAAGILLAYAGSRLLGGMLYGVSVLDAWTWVTGAGLLLLLGLLACAMPALRAARQDPLLALRGD